MSKRLAGCRHGSERSSERHAQQVAGKVAVEGEECISNADWSLFVCAVCDGRRQYVEEMERFPFRSATKRRPDHGPSIDTFQPYTYINTNTPNTKCYVRGDEETPETDHIAY